MLARLLRPSGSALLIAVIAVFGFSTTLHAANRGTIPRSALPGVQPLDAIELREMPGVDVEALMAEDYERENSGVPVPIRFSTNVGVTLSTMNSGNWEDLDDGARLWRLRIASPGALSLSLGLERFDLPEGAAFWVHAPDGSWVQGPYTQQERNSLGGLWTAVVFGEELVAELLVPPGGKADIQISSVNHGYRVFGERELTSKRGSCNINVVCPVGNRLGDQIRSVARISFSSGSSGFLCTASLINNTAEDETPYLYSAGHCVQTDAEAATLVAYWNYQTSNCDDRTGGSLSQNQSGATLVAHSYQSESNFRYDFSLMELDQTPDEDFDVYYTGWDAREEIPVSTTTIHHPLGDQKSISFDFDPPTITSLSGSGSPGDGRYWRVGDWDLGTTEPGSSGSCLWDEVSGLCIGSLSGGFAACGNNEPDWYARFHQQWTGEGTSETRLADWLDPAGTTEGYLSGRNPGAVTTSQTWLIPSAASTPGAQGSNWKSQVSVANSSTSSRTAMVYFVPSGEPWPGSLLSGPHLIGPMGSLFLDDPLLADNPTDGLIYVTVDGGSTAAFSRTLNLADGGETLGQGMPAVELNDASLVTELVLPMVHSEPGRFRTNLGFAQTSAGKFSVWVYIYSADSVLLAERKYAISSAWRQVDDIFAKMGIGNAAVEGGWIRVVLSAGSPAYWTTYATVIDDVTNDPTYVSPVAP